MSTLKELNKDIEANLISVRKKDNYIQDLEYNYLKLN